MKHSLHAFNNIYTTEAWYVSHPLVQGPLPYEAQQLVIDQVKVLLPGVDDGDNDVMTNSFLWVMGTHLQIFWLNKAEKDMWSNVCSKHMWRMGWIRGETKGDTGDTFMQTRAKSTPVRSLARSGWFMRQWLANFTHSSLTGTWMSLNLEKNTSYTYNTFKWIMHHTLRKQVNKKGIHCGKDKWSV